MKKAGLSILAVFLLVCSCKNPVIMTESDSPSNAVTLSVASPERVAGPSFSSVTYALTGAGPDNATFSKSFTGTSVTTSALTPGSWTFRIDMLSSGVIVKSGSVTLNVGTDASASVYLSPVFTTGMGTLTLSVSWPSSRTLDEVVGVLTPLAGGAPTIIDITEQSTYAYCTTTVPAGAYLFSLSGKNKGLAVTSVTMDAILVYAGKTTTWRPKFTDTTANPQFLSGLKDFLSFSIPSLATNGVADEYSPIMRMYAPLTTDLTAVTPSFTLPDGASATVAGVPQTSGVSSVDFSYPVTYAITAADRTTKNWTARVDRWKSKKIETSATSAGVVYKILLSDSKIYAACYRGLFVSSDGGDTWSVWDNTSGMGGDSVYDVEIVGDTIYAATNAGISVSTNAGATWTKYNGFDGTATSFSVRDIYLDGSGTIYLAAGGVLFRSSSAEGPWTKLTMTYFYETLRVATLGSKILAVQGSKLYISSNAGDSWSVVNSDLPVGVNDLVISGSNIYLSCGSGFWLSTNGGSSWVNCTAGRNFPYNGYLASIRGAAISGSEIYLATDLGVSVSSSNGAAWANFSMASSGLAEGTVFSVAAGNGKVYSGHSGWISVGDISASWPTATPAQVTGVTVTQGASGSAVVSWDRAPGAYNYTAYYGTSSDVSKATTTRVVNASSPCTITGLTPGVTYYFVVTASNPRGESEDSSRISRNVQ